MDRFFLIYIGLFLFTSCKSTLVNIYLENKGVYNEYVSIHQLQNKQGKKVVFIPMFHIGTEGFYNDVASKTDSLETQGFYFYYELVGHSNNDSILRKHKKISEKPYPKNGNLDIVDTIFKGNFKPKKELISQPSYSNLGLDSLNSRNVDVTIEDMVNLYEQKLGPIVLEPCDYETTLFEVTVCNDPITKESKEVLSDLRLNYRNQVVIKEIITDPRKKIAIIYGKNHYEGIKEGLLKEGYTEIK